MMLAAQLLVGCMNKKMELTQVLTRLGEMLYITGKGDLPSCTCCTTLFISPHPEKPYLPCSSSVSLSNGIAIPSMSQSGPYASSIIQASPALSLPNPSPSQCMLICLQQLSKLLVALHPYPTATRAGHQHLLPELLQPLLDDLAFLHSSLLYLLLYRKVPPILKPIQITQGLC